MVVCALTCYVILLSECDLKVTHVLCCLIWELMLYELKLSHNSVEPTKNICWAKAEITADHSTVTRWFKKFCSGFKNFNNQVKLGGPKTSDSNALFQAIGENLTSNTWKVSGKLSISQSSVVSHLSDLDWNCALHYQKNSTTFHSPEYNKGIFGLCNYGRFTKYLRN